MGINDGTVIGTAKVLNSGPDSQRFNIAILSDGFRENELSNFAAAVNTFIAKLHEIQPFDELIHAINVYRVDIASIESGADDPTTGGGTGATVRTYLDATFGAGGNRRSLVVNNTLAIQTANESVPAHHMVMVVVNSTIYGGTGGTVATYSMHASAPLIAIHEMGHTAFGLADEYEYFRGCGIDTDRNRHPVGELQQPNVSTTGNRDGIKWRDIVALETPMPTTSNADCRVCDPQSSPVPPGTVGAFEGAHYYHCGAFRPEYTCMMRALGNPFCAPCRRAIFRALMQYRPARQHTGVFNTMEVRPWNLPLAVNSQRVLFPTPLGTSPSIATGLNWIDADRRSNLRVIARADEVTINGYLARINTWSDTVMYSAGASLLSINILNHDIQVGRFNTQEDHPWNEPRPHTERRISFSRPFANTPQVVTWIAGIDAANSAGLRIRTSAINVNSTGFTISVDSWADTVLFSAEVFWIAVAPYATGIAVGEYNTQAVRPWNEPRPSTSADAYFPAGKFSLPPRVLVGFSSVDISNATNARVKTFVRSITKDKFTWNFDSWSDTVLFSGSAAYIAC